jgi:hypothetical protein
MLEHRVGHGRERALVGGEGGVRSREGERKRKRKRNCGSG